MKKLLIALHGALVSTVILPVFQISFLESSRGFDFPWCKTGEYYHVISPLGTLICAANHRWYFPSVIAAGFPAFLAALNLPLLLWLRGESGDRWKAYSSLTFGLLSTAAMSQLLPRYGYGRYWGGWVIWSLSLGLMIAGLAAVSRLRTSGNPLPVMQDSAT